MFTVEFFGDEISLHVWFNSSNGFTSSMRVREIDIVPLLMELIGNLDGFVDIVVNRFKIVGSELDLHTIGFPWPLEDSQGSITSVGESTVITVFGDTSNS
jgi:hypothetical protein